MRRDGAMREAPQKTYASMKKLGVRYLQFIPCLDPLEEQRGPRSIFIDAKTVWRFFVRVV